MKTCRKCGEMKPGEAFHRNPRTRDGRKGECAACATQYAVEWAKQNRARFRANQKRHRLRKLYGLTPDDLDRMIASQGGRCAICGRIPDERLCVDHNHITGQIRGLLCGSCNYGLGMFGDDMTRLESAADYLRAHAPVTLPRI